MNELLQYSPLATFIVVLIAVIGNFFRGDGASSIALAASTAASSLAATTAATNATTAATLATLQASIDRLGPILDRIDGRVEGHETRLVKLETEHANRFNDRRLETLDILKEHGQKA